MKAEEVERLCENYGADVYRFCIRMTGSRTDAEDLYQQTFLKLCEIKQKIDWENNPRSFLLGVAALTAKSSRRRFARRQRLAPQIQLFEEPGYKTAVPGVEQQSFERERQEAVRQAVSALPQKLKAPVVLYYALELSVEEIARTLNIPAGTVKSRLYKARNQLREQMEEWRYARE